MSSEHEDDKGRVAIAKALRAIEENWAPQMQLIAMQARIVRARYDALLKAGFSEPQALELCSKDIKL